MTLSEHGELPGYYTSSHGGWEFSLDEDGNIETVQEALKAWAEWRDFLLNREHADGRETLF